MKKILLNAAIFSLSALPAYLFAQKDKAKEKIKDKQTEEIIIRNKGEKELKLKVEIDGEKITVNGKPLADFTDNNITINKRKMTIRDGGSEMSFDFGDDFMKEFGGKEEIRAFLGVTTEVTADGAAITDVSKESAAEKAGLKKGDVILKIDEDKIDEEHNLYDAISFKKPKQEIKITYKRDGKENTAKAVLGEKKGSRSFSFNGPRGSVRSFSMPRMAPHPEMEWNNGDGPADLSPEGNFDMSPYMDFAYSFGRQKKIGLKLQDTEEGGGVKVINVEDSSAAALAGLKKDDIITKINEKKVNNTDEAREELMPDEDKKSYKMKVKREGKEMNVEVKIPRKLKTADF